MTPRFKTISEKGGLSNHLAELGIDAEVFYHYDDMHLKNTVIAQLLSDMFKRTVNRHSVGRWRKQRSIESGRNNQDTSTNDKHAEL